MTAPTLPARCGSTSPKHRVAKCRPCCAIRLKAWRAKRRVPRLPTAFCAFCGLAQGNARGVNVTRYPLIRYIANIRSNRNIASLPICDPCVQDHAIPSPSYMKARGLDKPVWPDQRDRNDGLRSHEGTASNLEALAS